MKLNMEKRQKQNKIIRRKLSKAKKCFLPAILSITILLSVSQTYAASISSQSNQKPVLDKTLINEVLSKAPDNINYSAGPRPAKKLLSTDQADDQLAYIQDYNKSIHDDGRTDQKAINFYRTNESDYPEMTSLANEITKDATSDYDKVLKIHDWVSANIYYDLDSYFQGLYGDNSAITVFNTKKGVCAGYANVTNQLIRSIGIPCKEITGFALGSNEYWNSDNKDIQEGNHAWNEVYINNRWMIIDTTWDSRNNYKDGKFNTGSVDHKYFDISTDIFSYDHKITEEDENGVPAIYTNSDIREDGTFLWPDSETSIKYNAFKGCTYLTNIIIPGTVKHIRGYAFSGTSLLNINIPDSVFTISFNTFYNAMYLSEINVGTNNPVYSSSNGVLFNKTKTELISFPAYHDNPTTANDQSYTIPDGVTEIGYEAFHTCYFLHDLTIPQSVIAVGYAPFFACISLDDIYVNQSNTNYASVGGVLFNKDKTMIIAYPPLRKNTEYKIPASVTSIDGYAFFFCRGAGSVIMPDSLIRINGCSFAMSFLRTITIPSSVTSIDIKAFDSSSDLTAAIFLGNAPGVGFAPFVNCADNFKVYYQENNSGFTNPWNGYNTTSERYLAYQDISSVGWAQDAINRLSMDNIINGYDDGTFRPYNNITRAEFIKLLVSTFDTVDWSSYSSFSDVYFMEWYYPYVASAEKAGLTNGNGDGTFGPGSTMTREEMFTFCARAIYKYDSYSLLDSSDPETATVLSGFADSSYISGWAQGYVATVIKAGLVTGSPSGNTLVLYPKNPITRAEVAVVLDRALK